MGNPSSENACQISATNDLPAILFNCCKHESHTPSQGFKQMVRRLRGSYRIFVNKEEISLEILRGSSVVIFGCPREKFTKIEVDDLKKFVDEGGCVLLSSAQGGDSQHKTNLNAFLQDFGVTVNPDCLVRPVQEKYFHPKEVLITDGILCNEIKHFARKQSKTFETTRLPWTEPNLESDEVIDDSGLRIVYPYGATLSTHRPAIPILSSGLIAFPIHRPLGALFSSARGQGRVAVIGSTAMFDDTWLDKEDNFKLLEFLMSWLTKQNNIKADIICVDEVESGDFLSVPNTQALASRVRCCLQEPEELPKDFTKLVDDKLFEYRTKVVRNVAALYKKLGVPHVPLTLIKPQFEVPMWPVTFAVHEPAWREPPPPPLELFDLDECFAPPIVRLSQLTNKCKNASNEDLHFYIVEGASIVGVTPKVVGVAENARDTTKALLVFIVHELVKMKKPQTNTQQSCVSPNADFALTQ